MKEKNKKQLSRKTIFLIYLFLSVATVVVHDWFIDSRISDVRESLHSQVIANEAPAPIQYRIMVYYMAEYMIKAGVPFNAAYNIIRFLFTYLSCIALHYFFMIFVSETISVLGVLFFLAALPITYIRYYMQPMDVPNMFFITLGYYLIAKRKDEYLYLLIPISMINRETAILLIFVYVFNRFDEISFKKLLTNSFAMSVLGLGTYVFLRAVFGHKEYYSDLFYLKYNIKAFEVYLYAACMMGPFVYLALKEYSNLPKFIKRTFLMLPYFLIIHFTMTIMSEPRLWLAILPVTIIAGIYLLFKNERKEYMESDAGEKISNILNFNKKLSYIAALCAFGAFFIAFFAYYRTSHIKDYRKFKLKEQIISEAKTFSNSGWNDRALEILESALYMYPDDESIHYEIANIYAYRIYEPEKALKHFKKVLKIKPNHLDKKRIESEIGRFNYYLNAR